MYDFDIKMRKEFIQRIIDKLSKNRLLMDAKKLLKKNVSDYYLSLLHLKLAN